MKPSKDMYSTLSMPGKKIAVCSRRIGTRDRMSIIAICTQEGSADKIVDALNMFQGETTKLEAAAT